MKRLIKFEKHFGILIIVATTAVLACLILSVAEFPNLVDSIFDTATTLSERELLESTYSASILTLFLLILLPVWFLFVCVIFDLYNYGIDMILGKKKVKKR